MRTTARLLGLVLFVFTHQAMAGDGRYEPPVPGCQNLEAKPARPIKLKGKIFGTYLPDGKRYTKLEPPKGPDGFEVGVLDLSKPHEKIRRLTTDEMHDAEIRASPDGRKIVWSVRRHLDSFDNDNTIMIANSDMTDKKVIAEGVSHYFGIPSFSKPDGSKVLFVSQAESDPAAKLMIHDLKTSKTTEFKTDFKGSIVDPQMSRDGKKIAFKSPPLGVPEPDDIPIYIMDSDGTNVKKLTKGDTADEDPAFSPDGRYLAFERMYGVTEHRGLRADDYFFQVGVVVLDLKTGKEKALTEADPCGKNELWLPTWSPDGKYIMFTRGLHLENGEFIHDLWVMRKDGSDLQRVPNSDGIMFLDWVE